VIAGQAQEAWRYWGEPEARSLEAERHRLQTQLNGLAKSEHEREGLLQRHPDAPGRLAELERDIRLAQPLENARRQQSLRREHQRHHDRGYSHQRDADNGIDM